MSYLYLRSAALGLAAGLAAIGGAAGCGLISSDVTNFDLTLPDKKFTIDASGWDVQQTDADKFTALSCASNTSVCSSAVTQACMTGCSGICNAAKTCDLSLDVSAKMPVDLVMEKPELKSINDEPVIKVTIDSVTYDVTSNSLNVATPPINVYVGATTVLKPNDPANPGTLIGTIPSIPAGQTTSAQTLMFSPTGKADLVKFMNSFKTPFNVLVGSSLLVTSGQPVPMGKLDAVVHIKGHAGV
jgi:hypothetical protein